MKTRSLSLLPVMVSLLSVSMLLVKQAAGSSPPCSSGIPYENTAVAIGAVVDGGQATNWSSATQGGSGGRIIVRTGVDVDTGDGSNGPLTSDVTLTSGTYNYTEVPIASLLTITIDGDVTINCQGLFAANWVFGVFHPDQPPPRIRVNAGHPVIAIGGTQVKTFHTAAFLMGSSRIGDASGQTLRPDVFNSDGSGMDGGIVEFYTTEAGDISMSSFGADGHHGHNGGNGGDGGEITVVANGGVVECLAVARGGDGYGPDWGQGITLGSGGDGGDGGKILLSGLGFTGWHCSLSSLSADGGDGANAGEPAAIHPAGFRGGNGGSGGAIAILAPLCPSNTCLASAVGRNGGNAGRGLSGIGAGNNGFAGGNGGSGGAPGVIIGITGTNAPGNGGNGGDGGQGAGGANAPCCPYTGPGGSGGNGGAGGNGGDSGGVGATPGTGGAGRSGGAGGQGHPDGPPGQNGPDGQSGIVGNPAPPKSPSASASNYTYVLCVGTADIDPNPLSFTNWPFLNGDIGAALVRDAFLRLPNVNLAAKAIPLDTSLGSGNRDIVARAINRAADRLRPGDNFIFYINCHGGFNESGDEPLVIIEDGPQTGEYNTGDEVLGLWRLTDKTWPISDLWKDDLLTYLFDGGVWNDVNKLFIMDTCYAGGYWASGLFDSGDLVRLPKAAILAVCSEARTSIFRSDTSPNAHGAHWGVLGQSLVKALDSVKSWPAITFSGLCERTAVEGAMFDGAEGFLLDLTTNFATRATNSWAPVATSSSDFVFNLVLTTNAPPTITAANPLPLGTVGTPYSETLQATNGTTPYTWSVVSGGLPPGLQLVASSGAITGTPTVATAGSFRVRVADAKSLYSEKDFSLTVNAAYELLTITKLQGNLNFAKANADSCTVKGTFDLPADYSFAGKVVTVAMGDAGVSFTLGSKGSGRSGLSLFNKPTYNKKTGLWTINATLKNGSWQSSWAEYGMVNATIPKPGVLVTNFPVVLVIDTEAFMATPLLHYTAKQDKSGTAK